MNKYLEKLKGRIQSAINFVFRQSRSKAMSSDFEQLSAELLTITKLSQSGGANGFFGQEALRFHSIAGTLLAIEGFELNEKSSEDERYITHVLSRSLLENYFTILYLFDDPAETANRFEELKNSFKVDYRKLWNEPKLPRKSELEPADPAWKGLSGLPNVNSMLVKVKNDHGDRLDYLYFVYRIASFDTHGMSLETIFKDVFGKKCSFPILKIKYAFELIANQYLVVLQDLRNGGVI